MDINFVASVIKKNEALEDIVMRKVILPLLDGMEIFNLKMGVERTSVLLDEIKMSPMLENITDDGVVSFSLNGVILLDYCDTSVIVNIEKTKKGIEDTLPFYVDEIERLTKEIKDFITVSEDGYSLNDLKEELVEYQKLNELMTKINNAIYL